MESGFLYGYIFDLVQIMIRCIFIQKLRSPVKQKAVKVSRTLTVKATVEFSFITFSSEPHNETNYEPRFEFNNDSHRSLKRSIWSKFHVPHSLKYFFLNVIFVYYHYFQCQYFRIFFSFYSNSLIATL